MKDDFDWLEYKYETPLGVNVCPAWYDQTTADCRYDHSTMHNAYLCGCLVDGHIGFVLPAISIYMWTNELRFTPTYIRQSSNVDANVILVTFTKTTDLHSIKSNPWLITFFLLL